MKKTSVHHLKPGMVTADTVLDFDRKIVLEKGIIITEAHIQKLIAHNVIAVNIEEDKKAQDPHPQVQEDFTPDHALTYTERIRQSPEFREFKAGYEKNLTVFKGILNDVVQKHAVEDLNILLHDSLDLVSVTKTKGHVLDMLQSIQEYDDDTYAHSLNVALICNVLAGWLKFSEEEVDLATACGLFHDIGKLLVPPELIQKPSRLSQDEYRQVKTHTVKGYTTLRDQNMNVHVQNAALMHHERMDGTGYPLELKGEQIDKYARLVAIADVYDAMTAKRVYREALSPFEAIEIFEKDGFQCYEAAYLLPFLERVTSTYLRSQCLLNNGKIGTVVFINQDKPSRPIVECEGQYLDLKVLPQIRLLKLL